MTESVLIVLRLPPRVLSPNKPTASRGGRMAKAAATRKYRDEARKAIEAQGIESGPWAPAVAKLTFYWPDGRRRDLRNAEASMKAAYDGIVDAGLLPDDCAGVLGHAPTEFAVDEEWPRVEIRVTRSE